MHVMIRRLSITNTTNNNIQQILFVCDGLAFHFLTNKNISNVLRCARAVEVNQLMTAIRTPAGYRTLTLYIIVITACAILLL